MTMTCVKLTLEDSHIGLGLQGVRDRRIRLACKAYDATSLKRRLKRKTCCAHQGYNLLRLYHSSCGRAFKYTKPKIFN